MLLVQVFNSREAFSRLSVLKKPPKLAYRLMKYAHKFDAEAAVCENQRAKIVCEIAGVEAGSAEAAAVMFLPGSKEYDTWLARFNEFLQTESVIEPVGVSMDALIDGLDAEQGNVLSEADLAAMEPFFAEKAAPDLKLVG